MTSAATAVQISAAPNACSHDSVGSVGNKPNNIPAPNFKFQFFNGPASTFVPEVFPQNYPTIAITNATEMRVVGVNTGIVPLECGCNDVVTEVKYILKCGTPTSSTLQPYSV